MYVLYSVGGSAQSVSSACLYRSTSRTRVRVGRKCRNRANVPSTLQLKEEIPTSVFETNPIKFPRTVLFKQGHSSSAGPKCSAI